MATFDGKLIPLLCRQTHIQSLRQTDCTPRTASKWRGAAEASLCLSFLSCFTLNCNRISADNNTHTRTQMYTHINPPPTEQRNDLVTWWDWDDLELLISVFWEARHTGTNSRALIDAAVFSDWLSAVFFYNSTVHFMKYIEYFTNNR